MTEQRRPMGRHNSGEKTDNQQGASNIIPETAKVTSITLFESSPVGCGDPVAENRKLRTSTNPFMWVTPKNTFKNKFPLPLFLNSFLSK